MFDGFVFKMASDSERLQAIALRREIYTQEWGRPPDDELDDRAYHLVACSEAGEVIATMRIIGQEGRPFEFEQAIALSELFGPDRNVAVTGGLCVRRDFRAVTRQTFIALGLFKASLVFARKEGITDFLTYVYESLSQFYGRAFFTVIVPEFQHPTWGKMCLMHLDLLEFERRHSQSRTPLDRLLFATDLPNIQL